MSELKIGYCGLCDTKIWDDVLDKNGRVINRKTNAQYAEVSMVLSNGSVAKLALCQSHASSITSKQVSEVFAKIQAYWRGEMAGWATERQFDKMDGLVVKAWDRDEKKSINKYNEIKAIEHKEKVEHKKVDKKI